MTKAALETRPSSLDLSQLCPLFNLLGVKNAFQLKNYRFYTFYTSVPTFIYNQ